MRSPKYAPGYKKVLDFERRCFEKFRSVVEEDKLLDQTWVEVLDVTDPRAEKQAEKLRREIDALRRAKQKPWRPSLQEMGDTLGIPQLYHRVFSVPADYIEGGGVQFEDAAVGDSESEPSSDESSREVAVREERYGPFKLSQLFYDTVDAFGDLFH